MKNNSLRRFTLRINTIVFVMCIAAFCCMPGSVRADVSETLKQADECFMKNDNERALELYDEVITGSKDKELVMLATYKKAYILEDRLFRYGEAMVLYKDIMKDYAGTDHAARAERKYTALSELDSRGELELYAEFNRIRDEYHRARNARQQSPGQHKNAVKAMRDFAVDNRSVSFKDDLLRTALVILVQDKIFLRAGNLIRIIEKEYGPDRLEAFRQDIKTVRKYLVRYRIYWVSLAVVGLVVLFIIIGKGWRNLGGFVAERKGFLVCATVIPAVFLVAWFFVFVLKDLHAKFSPRHLLFLFLAYVCTVMLSLLYNNSLSMIQNGRLRNGMKWGVSSLLGIAAWMIYAFHMDFLWVIGL